MQLQAPAMSDPTMASPAIPRRTPVDSSWFKHIDSIARFDSSKLTPEEYEAVYGDPTVAYYMLVASLTLLMMAIIILVYIKCCMYALKGKFDLPAPGGGQLPTETFYIKNPLASMANRLFRYSAGWKKHDQVQPAQHPNVLKPLEGVNTITSIGPRRQAEGVARMDEGASSQASYPSASGEAPNTLFESQKANRGLCDSFKQFKQFQYGGLHEDRDQEEIVFDVLDLQ